MKGRDDGHRGRQMEGMRHRVPNSGKVLRERFVLLSSAMLHCPSFSLPPRLLLSVWRPCLDCDLFCSPLMLSVAILRGSPATRMDSVYTLASSVASHQHCHGWVCVCGGQRGGGGGCLCGRERARETESSHLGKHGSTPHSQDNFTIYLWTETLKAPYLSDLENSQRKSPPLEM